MELIIWKQFLLPKLMGIEKYTPKVTLEIRPY